jgi:hypothetical protein
MGGAETGAQFLSFVGCGVENEGSRYRFGSAL